MLGYSQIVLLVLAVLPLMVYPTFGETVITVTLNQDEYQTGDLLEISGSVSELSMPVIAMSIYDPDGTILVANNLDIDADNNFSKIMFLDAPFYEKPGEYRIKFDYSQTTHEEYFTLSNDSEPVIEEILTPEIILLTTDKPVYTHNDIITITGLVSSVESPTVLVGVYDPFGTPAGFYFGEIDSNFEFAVDFLAKSGVNFKTDGTYSIKAHYADSEETVSFEFYNTLESEFADKPITDVDQTSENTNNVNEDDSIDDTNDSDSNPLNDEEEFTNETNENIENSNDSIINNDQKSKTKENSNDSSIIDNEKKSKVNHEDAPKQDEPIPPQKFDNLTVEDIELGKLLNQINLNCDSSTFIDSITYYDGMGPALYRLCNWEDSLHSFDIALKDDPNNIEIISNKGSALAKMGYYYEAINQYDLALDIDPEFIPAINNKANALAKLGHTQEALYLYAQVIQENPNYITARKNMASALSQQSVQDEIIDVIRPETQETKKEIPPEPPKEESPLTEHVKQEKKPNFLEEFTKAISSLFGFLN